AGGVALMVVGTLIFFATLIAWNARALERVEDERARLIREQGARAQAEAAERRAAFLAQASAALSASLDYNSTLKSVPALAVPRLADWCALSSLDPEGTVRQLAVAHVDPAKEELAWEMEKRYPASLSAPYGPGRVIRTGAPELVGDIPDPLLEAVAQDEEHLRILRALGVTSYVAVPLIARGQTLGAIAFGAAGSGRRFGRDELTVAEEKARRALEAIERCARSEAQLVEDLLDVSRIITGKLRLDVRPVPLAPVVQAAVEVVRPAAEAKGLELQVVLDAEVGTVTG